MVKGNPHRAWTNPSPSNPWTEKLIESAFSSSNSTKIFFNKISI